MKEYDNLDSLSDFELFIKENNITSRYIFNLKFPKIYRKFKKSIPKEDQDRILPLKPNTDYSFLKTKEDIRNFLINNNIKDRTVFSRNFVGAYKRFRKLSIFDQEELLPSNKGKDYSYIRSTEDLIKFLKENNINSRQELKKFPGVLSIFRALPEEERDKAIPTVRNVDLSVNSYTEKDFKDFIKVNNIVSRSDFKKRFSGVFRRFKKLLTIEEQNRVLSPVLENHTYLVTVSDFKKYIEENGIKSREDFTRQIYRRFITFLTKEEQNDLLPKKVNDYSSFNTINDFQEYINENHIESHTEFMKNHRSLYERFIRMFSNDGDRDKLSYCESETKHHSYGEKCLIKLFKENNISYTTEKTFDKLKNIKLLRYDFYLPEYNILVEHHGEAHFGVGMYYSEGLIENDKKKFEFANNNNITILYFTIYEKVYEEFGYFTEVLTDPQILIQKIKEIGPTNQSSVNN